MFTRDLEYHGHGYYEMKRDEWLWRHLGIDQVAATNTMKRSFRAEGSNEEGKASADVGRTWSPKKKRDERKPIACLIRWLSRSFRIAQLRPFCIIIDIYLYTSKDIFRATCARLSATDAESGSPITPFLGKEKNCFQESLVVTPLSPPCRLGNDPRDDAAESRRRMS